VTAPELINGTMINSVCVSQQQSEQTAANLNQQHDSSIFHFAQSISWEYWHTDILAHSINMYSLSINMYSLSQLVTACLTSSSSSSELIWGGGLQTKR